MGFMLGALVEFYVRYRPVHGLIHLSLCGGLSILNCSP